MNTTTVNDVAVQYAQHGSGVAVLALHGAYSTHHEIESFLEPLFDDRPGYRRIYPDLPGQGDTPAPTTIRSSHDVLDVIVGFVDDVIGDGEFLVVGHSAGAYLARGVASRRHAAGLALICPIMENPTLQTVDPAGHHLVKVTEPLDVEMTPAQEAEFRSYFVIQTTATARRFLHAVAPVLGHFDAEALERIAGQWRLDPSPDTSPPFHESTLIITGRHDTVAGYRDQWRLIDHYPQATYASLAQAGHALPHEQPQLLHALLGSWLDEANTPRR